jgi:hypothetical protein
MGIGIQSTTAQPVRSVPPPAPRARPGSEEVQAGAQQAAPAPDAVTVELKGSSESAFQQGREGEQDRETRALAAIGRLRTEGARRAAAPALEGQNDDAEAAARTLESKVAVAAQAEAEADAKASAEEAAALAEFEAGFTARESNEEEQVLLQDPEAANFAFEAVRVDGDVEISVEEAPEAAPTRPAGEERLVRLELGNPAADALEARAAQQAADDAADAVEQAEAAVEQAEPEEAVIAAPGEEGASFAQELAEDAEETAEETASRADERAEQAVEAAQADGPTPVEAETVRREASEQATAQARQASAEAEEARAEVKAAKAEAKATATPNEPTAEKLAQERAEEPRPDERAAQQEVTFTRSNGRLARVAEVLSAYAAQG